MTDIIRLPDISALITICRQILVQISIICRATFLMISAFVWLFVGMMVLKNNYDICLFVEPFKTYIIVGVAGFGLYEVFYGLKQLKEKKEVTTQ